VAQNAVSLPPLHPVFVYTVYLFTKGRGVELTREKVRGAIVHKAGLTVSLVYKPY